MLGYILPEKPELKIKEYEIYSAYYCGICKSIGKRHGQIPRMTLSYDSAFLALILAGVEAEKGRLSIERCFVHPLRKKTILYDSSAVDYAADMHLLMMYHKFKDDYSDDRNMAAAAGAGLMRGLYKRLSARYPDKSKLIKDQMQLLTALEKDKTPSLDRAAEPYSKIMEIVFEYEGKYSLEGAEQKKNDLGRLGYHVGKWVYAIDAFDDIEDDIKKKSYNPLLYQFKFDQGNETASEFKERITSRIEISLVYCLAELAKTVDALKIDQNRELIENIIYLGLLRKTEEVLGKGRKEEHAESI